jgi:hypothetical protein
METSLNLKEYIQKFGNDLSEVSSHDNFPANDETSDDFNHLSFTLSLPDSFDVGLQEQPQARI